MAVAQSATQTEGVVPVRGSAAMRYLEPLLMHVVIPAGFVLLVLGIMPIREAFEFDTDEGLNLIKAALLGQGYALHREIWSDQPPLFTALLHGWFGIVGESVAAGRALVLVFATLLIWSLAQAVRMTCGVWPAVAATVLLAFSWLFVRLSGSVMIGLPSLALAMLALVALLQYQRRPRMLMLIASGMLLACSLQTKMFTATLIPLMLAMLLMHSAPRKAVALWLGSLALVFVAIGWWFGSLVPGQLVTAQVGTAVREAMAVDSTPYGALLMRDVAYWPLALLGILWLCLKRDRIAWFPLAWLILSAAVLWFHAPRWHHHTVLIALPLSWLAAMGLMWLWHGRDGRKVRVLQLAALAAALLVLVQLPGKFTQIRGSAVDLGGSAELERRIALGRPFTRWIFTDRPMYAVRANLLVPPETAVISRKRIRSGHLTSEQILLAWRTYEPEQIVLSRFRWSSFSPYDDACMAHLDDHYALTYDDGTNAHYIIKAHAPAMPKPPMEQRLRSWLRGWR